MDTTLQRGTSSASCRIGLVTDLSTLPILWPLIKPWIIEIAETSRGKVNEQNIAEAIIADLMHLWLVRANGELVGISITEFAFFPQKIICRVVGMVGEDLLKWLHLREVVETWASFRGCEGMQIIGRKGYAKFLPDYAQTHVLLEKDLEVYHA